MKTAVTGANSSVGRNLLGHIAEQRDVTAVAGVRSEHAAAALPEAEGVRSTLVSYEDVDGLAEAFKGVDSVVHLAGVLFETRNSSYRKANVETTAAVVEAAKRAQVTHILFVSVMGADANSSNAYLRSKGEAENLVTGSGMAATVIRTPMLLGPDTAGGQALAGSASGGTARVPGGGQYTVRPLDVDDLSRAILQACRNPPEGSVTHELVGPEPLRYRELIERTATAMDRDVRIATVPIWLLRFLSGASYLFKRSGMSPAIIDVITANETVSENADRDLGITLTPLSETLEKIADKERIAHG